MCNNDKELKTKRINSPIFCSFKLGRARRRDLKTRRTTVHVFGRHLGTRYSLKVQVTGMATASVVVVVVVVNR
jgi:hypothetical protein